MTGTQDILGRTALYRFFDSSGHLLYVGITSSPVVRFARHGRESSWWKSADHSKTTVEWHADRPLAVAAERTAIMTERPQFNVVGTRGYVSRPAPGLSDDQRGLLAAAVKTAGNARRLRQELWDLALVARNAGVPDEVLCDESGLSRSTLNRKCGPRRELGES